MVPVDLKFFFFEKKLYCKSPRGIEPSLRQETKLKQVPILPLDQVLTLLPETSCFCIFNEFLNINTGSMQKLLR